MIKDDLENNKVTPASQNVFVILVALAESIPVESIFTQEICDLAVELFKTSFNEDFCTTGLDFLEDAECKFILSKIVNYINTLLLEFSTLNYY